MDSWKFLLSLPCFTLPSPPDDSDTTFSPVGPWPCTYLLLPPFLAAATTGFALPPPTSFLEQHLFSNDHPLPPSLHSRTPFWFLKHKSLFFFFFSTKTPRGSWDLHFFFFSASGYFLSILDFSFPDHQPPLPPQRTRSPLSPPFSADILLFPPPPPPRFTS